MSSSLQFSEFIIANVRLYALRNDSRLSTHAIAHFTRRELATALRKVRNPSAPTPSDSI
jgi:20S proteasome subunit beta 4